MSYDLSLLKRVAGEFAAKRQARERLLDARQKEVYEKIPRLSEIDKALSKLSFSVFRQVADGLDPSLAADKILRTGKKLRSERAALITGAGFPANYLDPSYDCDKCKDEGFYGGGYCSCFEAALIEAAFCESNLASLSKNTFSDFSLEYYDTAPDTQHGMSPRDNMTRILTLCKNFAENFDSQDKGLLFYGSSGLGKTFLSSCIANELLRKGYSVIYQSAGTIFSTLDAIRFNKSVDEAQRYAASRLLDADLLILDDLGTEFSSEYSISELFRIINSRLFTGKLTIISTNLSIPNLRSVYSERIISRILGSFRLVSFYGKDIRLMKQFGN